MGSKKVNYIELFIDKAAIAIAGLIAVIILFVFVLRGPQIDGMGPSEIDEAVNRKANHLEEQMREEPNENIKYVSKQQGYLALLNNSIKEVNDRINFPLAGNQASVIPGSSKFTYQVPKIGKIEKPTSAVVRMAAFVPTEELSMNVTYESAGKRLEDLDLVTVESSIDVKSLYGKFRESFAARSFPAEKRKEQYAKPVFAKVQLQRRTQQSDGNWSEWFEVPQTKICYLKKNLAIPKEPSEYGTEMALVQFAKSEFRDEVLQPAVYCNALPTEAWISPSFYNQRQIKLGKYQEELRRLEIEAERARKLSDRAAPSRETRTPTRIVDEPAGRTREPAPSRNQPRREPTPRTAPTRRVPERPAAPATSASSLNMNEESDFDAIKLKTETNLEDLDKLVFWAHDDTAQPGETYQYRIRIGVFNPIAGRDWFGEEQKEYRDEVVLWSDFAEVNEQIEIPQRFYFFATDIRDLEKGASTDKTVEVVVARYTLGNWVSKKYNVKSGEEIGKADEPPDARLANSDLIDFSTGAVMIDARRVTEWYGTGTLRSRDYYELLYSFDGKIIEKVPVRERFWTAKVTQIYKEISTALNAQPIALLDWQQAASGASRRMPVRQPDSFETESQPPFSPEGAPMPFMP